MTDDIPPEARTLTGASDATPPESSPSDEALKALEELLASKQLEVAAVATLSLARDEDRWLVWQGSSINASV
jgi:hypothetical protein